jgi:lipoate-protein ligase A
MHVLDLTLPAVHANLALDEALLLTAQRGEGSEVLRLWEHPAPAVVLGVSGRIADDVDEAACRADAVPLARRASGGGTVLLGPGCLAFAMVLSLDRRPELRDVTNSYAVIMDRLAAALQPLAGDLRLSRAGGSDLALGEHKVSGNAQRRTRSFVLHHGTILYAFDLDLLPRYLCQPERQPDYRRGRDHQAFVRNFPAPVDAIKGRVRTAWEATTPLGSWPTALVDDLVATKYAKEEWILRR